MQDQKKKHTQIIPKTFTFQWHRFGLGYYAMIS